MCLPLKSMRMVCTLGIQVDLPTSTTSSTGGVREGRREGETDGRMNNLLVAREGEKGREGEREGGREEGQGVLTWLLAILASRSTFSTGSMHLRK